MPRVGPFKIRMRAPGCVVQRVVGNVPDLVIPEDMDSQFWRVKDRATTVPCGIALAGDDPEVSYTEMVDNVTVGTPLGSGRVEEQPGLQTIEPAWGYGIEPMFPCGRVLPIGRLPRRDDDTVSLPNDPELDCATVLGVLPPTVNINVTYSIFILLNNLKRGDTPVDTHSYKVFGHDTSVPPVYVLHNPKAVHSQFL
jgi:hypothetical protein